MQSLATNLARTVKDKAVGVVEEQKATAAEQVDSVARLIEDVAGKVEQEVPVIAPYLREAASSIHRVSSGLRERSSDDLLQEVSEFGRRRPAALVGASLIAGFALARFLKSSADRRAGAERDRAGQTAAEPSPSRPLEPDQPSEAELADAPSPVTGMTSLAKGTAPSTAAGTSVGGDALAPEPHQAERI